MSDHPSHDNPRSEERRVVVTFVWYKLLPERKTGGTPTPEGLARSCDISAQGVGIVCPHPMPTGAQVFLEIGLRGGRLSAVARVRHCTPEGPGRYRIGFTLDVLPPNDRQALSRLLED